MNIKNLRISAIILLTLAIAVLILDIWASLSWHYVLDSPLMLYIGFLIDKFGMVPYRDIFDMNMPGTYFLMGLFGKIFGWSDLAFRFIDLLWLAAISVATFIWMRPFGRLSAVLAVVLFPMHYFAYRTEMSLQREYLCILPLALLLSLCFTEMKLNYYIKLFIAGVLLAAGALVKPQFLFIALPIIVYIIYQARSRNGNIYKTLFLLGSGFVIPCFITLVYLISTNSLRPFLDIYINYLPLYSHLDINNTTIAGFDRVIYIIKWTFIGLKTVYLPIAILGLYVMFRSKIMRDRTFLLSALLLVSGLYPALSGKFWCYHWLPFWYIMLCISALNFSVLKEEKSSIFTYVPFLAGLAILIAFCIHQVSVVNTLLPHQDIVQETYLETPTKIHDYLSTHLKNGDTVQPLDWTGGAVHGMLMSRAKLATRFMYDFHFYHHISSPYIQGLRKEFMNEFQNSKARFVIEVFDNRPWPKGYDTSRDFPELRAYIQQSYHIVYAHKYFRIYERT